MPELTNKFDSWPSKPGDKEWDNPNITDHILGESEGPIEIDWVRECAKKMRNMRDMLRTGWIGLWHEELGHLTDWILACIIARENILLLGPPGVAKTEIVVRIFNLLRLNLPKKDDAVLSQEIPEKNPWKWWQERTKKEREIQKYFHYQLGRFTQPEDLFGPVEISLLRRGILVRVNSGFLTGAGVRAAFLDEIFKASSSILNTLLTLCQERTYFNWGGMDLSDLIILIGASNEMPGTFSSGSGIVSGMGEDFQDLYAFIDRFPIRIKIPLVSGTRHVHQGEEGRRINPDDNFGRYSDLGKASIRAIDRESQAFVYGAKKRFGIENNDAPCNINDLLLLGRACLQHKIFPDYCLFKDELKLFEDTLFLNASSLQREGATDVSKGQIKWTISPRKLKAIYKIALAHALVCDTKFADGDANVKLSAEDLRVMNMIWDSPVIADRLTTINKSSIHEFWISRGGRDKRE